MNTEAEVRGAIITITFIAFAMGCLVTWAIMYKKK